MTEIDQDIQDLIESAKSAADHVFEFITVQHVNPGEWPNGFKLRERYSRGMSLLGGLAGVKACAMTLGQTETVTVSGALSLYEPLKDYLCGLELMIHEFSIVFRQDEMGEEEDAIV